MKHFGVGIQRIRRGRGLKWCGAVSTMVLAAVAVSGCADSSGQSSAAENVEETLNDEVPEEFRDGVTVATQADIAPLTYVDENGERVGVEIDLVTAVAAKLGIPITIESVTFENLILGLESGKYDFVTNTTVKEERLKKYDMTTNLVSSYSTATSKDGPDIPSEESALCGLDVAVVVGEIIGPYLSNVVIPSCEEAGEAAPKVTEYKNFASATLAVRSGTHDAAVLDTMSLGYFLTTDAGQDFRFNGPDGIDENPTGYSFLKSGDAVDLAPAVQKAIQELMDDGTYMEILSDYGLDKSAINEVVINPDLTTWSK